MGGLKTKVSIVKNFCDIFEYHVFALTETWLTSSVCSDEFLIPPQSFHVYRHDRTLSRGGGSLLAVSKSLHSQLIHLHIPESLNRHVNIVAVNISNYNLTIIVLYISPSILTDNFSLLIDSLCNHAHLLNLNLLFVGDFNLPFFTNDISISNFSNSKVNNLHTLQMFYKLYQQNFIRNISNNILDLVFCTNNNYCSVLKIDNPIVKIDTYHPALEIVCLFENLSLNSDSTSDTPNKPKERFNFHKANYQSLYIELQETNFSNLCNNIDLNDTCLQLEEKLIQVCETHVPKYTEKISFQR